MSVKEHRFIIGRARECDIVLADNSVSRKHAELIFRSDGKLFLIDRKSQNGTALMLSGSPQTIRQEFVSPTDSIQFGNVHMSVKEILEAIRLKFPSFEAGPARPAPPPSQDAKEWVKGKQLKRCACGTVKREGEPCPECGQ